LSIHGGFLGVDNRYGLHELKRFLKIKIENRALWDTCDLVNLEGNLTSLGCSVATFQNRLSAIDYHLHKPDKPEKYRDILKHCNELAEIVTLLVRSDSEANKALQRTLDSSRR
jgi:hypothetical protein